MRVIQRRDSKCRVKDIKFIKTVDTKVVNSVKLLKGKLDIMIEKVNNHQSQQPEPVRIESKNE